MKDLSLAIIARNEEKNLAQCLDSVVSHVDEIVVVDTGSSDNTPGVAEKYGARVYFHTPETHPESFFCDDEDTCKVFGAPPPYSGQVMLGDFSAARRTAFSKCSGRFILWLDSDDVLEGAEHLRSVVAHMIRDAVDVGFVAYDYARDDQDRTYYRQWRERIIRAGCSSWVNEVHEVLIPVRSVLHAKYEQLTVVHRRQAERPHVVPNRNYKILLRRLEKDRATGTTPDPRTLFYLGQEARYIEPDRSAKFYEEYLLRSGWNEERAAAHMALGILAEIGALSGISREEALSRAEREYATAAAEMPDNPDGLFGLARIAYHRQRWMDCILYTERGQKIGNTESMLGANPLDRTFRPHLYLNFALAKIGRIEDAIASCKAALAVCPEGGLAEGGSAMLRQNIAAYEAELRVRSAPQLSPSAEPATREILNLGKDEDPAIPPQDIPADVLTIWALQLWKQVAHVERNKEKAYGFLTTLPNSITEDFVVERMRSTTDQLFPVSKAKTTSRKRVVIWAGPAIEPWDPTTPTKRGIGGSETACIEMAKNLHARGCDVTVFGCLPNNVSSGVWDGVKYVNYSSAPAKINCDVFISSRQPAVIESVDAPVKLLWVHDVNVGPSSPQMERWLLRFDRILCLSEWHRTHFCETYPILDREKVLVTRNGIDPNRFFMSDIQKKNHVITASSPNRGLFHLVANFPHVRARVPDAELHVFYGFDCWEAFARARGDTRELEGISQFKSFLNDRAHPGSGIRLHGRVGQDRLAQAYIQAKVWSHWTEFTETSCISAMEAQASGAVPLHSGVAALAETVKFGVCVPLGEPQRWVDECVRLLTDTSYREPIAAAGRYWAMESLSWSALAEEWIEMFRRVDKELEENPLPKYVQVG